MTRGVCGRCAHVAELPARDALDREICEDCGSVSAAIYLQAVSHLLETVPHAVGDVVECRTAGTLFDGVGRIEAVSFDPAEGGTPVYPSFRVALTEKAYPEAPDYAWYTEICLTATNQGATE